MADDQPVPPTSGESKLLGMSVRAVVMLVLTVAVCALAVTDEGVRATVTDGFLIALGFYFGSKPPAKQP